MKKIAVVTGASSGLGREFVRQIAKETALDEIWVIARRRDRLLALEQDYPGDYRVYMRLALLYADREGAKPTEQRDYTAMGAA